jgi:heat shock protein HslJ
MSGTYRFDDDVLVVGELGQTEMGCDAALMDQDQRIAALLMTKPAWSLRGDRLVLSGGGTRIELLDRKVAEPDQPLLGTKWTVQDVGNGDTVSHSTSGDAWLQFDGNAVHGSTGCNTVTGTFERDGDTLTFADVRTTLRKCPDAPYEAPMLAVLNRTARFAIDGTRLVLTGADGTSIGFSG